MGEKNYASGAFSAVALQGEKACLGAPGWAGEKSGLFEHPAGAFFLGAIKFCASAILDGQYDEVFFSNRIDNPIIALANPIEMVHASSLVTPGGCGLARSALSRFTKCYEAVW